MEVYVLLSGVYSCRKEYSEVVWDCFLRLLGVGGSFVRGFFNLKFGCPC